MRFKFCIKHIHPRCVSAWFHPALRWRRRACVAWQRDRERTASAWRAVRPRKRSVRGEQRPMVALSSLSLLLLYQTRHAQADTANADALARRAARKEWRQAWPGGCREYEGRKEAKGRFCSLTASVAGRDGRDITDLDDVTMTIGSVSRLRELAAAFSKRQARSTETLVPTAQDHAARAALAAVELAAGKHAKRDGERRQQAKKQKREVPARRVPAEYRCVKSTKTEPKSPEAVEFTCSVSDHTLEAAAAAGEETTGTTGTSADGEGGPAAAPPAKDGPEERCGKYKLWKAEYTAAFVPSDSTVGDGFYDYLAAHYEPFGALAKLRRHLHAVGGETGKAREAIERKAVKSYKALSKDCHPDKLPRAVGAACAKEMDGMMRAVFDRAEALKHCITKPLRCTLPLPTPTKRTCVGDAKNCNKAEL